MSIARVPLSRAGMAAARCYGMVSMQARAACLLAARTRTISSGVQSTSTHEEAKQPAKRGDVGRPGGAAYGFVRNADTKRQKLLDEILRVDHAGEVGAVNIYAGQMWVLKGTKVQDTLQVCTPRGACTMATSLPDVRVLACFEYDPPPSPTHALLM